MDILHSSLNFHIPHLHLVKIVIRSLQYVYKNNSSTYYLKDLIMYFFPMKATPEEINSAYRRFSRMFHPDKHSTDPNKQKWAEQIFNKVKEAYEVLSDSHKRAIYDTLGKVFYGTLIRFG